MPAPTPEKYADVKVIHVQTDVLNIEINLDGGDLQYAKLPTYPVTKGDPNNQVQLLSADPANIFVVGSGLRSVEGISEPNHRSTLLQIRTNMFLPTDRTSLL